MAGDGVGLIPDAMSILTKLMNYDFRRIRKNLF